MHQQQAAQPSPPPIPNVNKTPSRFDVSQRATLVPTPPRVAESPPVVPVQTRDPVAPDQVSDPDDRFRCDRLHGVLNAKTCVTRQNGAYAQRYFGRQLQGAEAKALGKAALFEPCRNCDVGLRIAAKLGQQINVPSKRKLPVIS